MSDTTAALEEALERSYKENRRLRDLVSRAPFAWDKFCILEGLIATEKDEDKRKEYALQYNRIGLEFGFEPCEAETRPRMEIAKSL